MTALLASAPGKVNLCLFLGRPREDGRHELVTLYESVSLADELRLSTAEADQVLCPGVDGPNLVTGALARLRELGWNGPPVRIEIAKRIPVAAGMGGGSADAAASLRLAQALDPVEPQLLTALAAELGADVPSQLEPGLALGTGAGELVRRLPPMVPHAWLILPSRFSLSTAEVYREADRLGLGRSAEELVLRQDQLQGALSGSGRLPDELIVNDLQPAAMSLCPSITDGLRDARSAGAEHALVCGSGPTIAGVFWGRAAARRATGAAAALGSRYPGATSAVPVPAEFGMPRIA